MKVLETERLFIRRQTADDAQFILELLNEPSFIQNIADRGVRTLEDARQYIENGPVASYQRFGFGLFLVELKESGVPIGMCGLLKRDYLDDVDIGYAFLERYWSKGYAYESATAMMSYARDVHQLRRIVATTTLNNDGSIRVLEKLGFHFEKLFRLPGSEDDSRFFAIEYPDIFDFSSFPLLTTERLQLRALTVDDADAIIDIFGDPEMLRYLNHPPTETREQALALIEWLNNLFPKHEGITWAITLENRLIGTCGLYGWDRSNRRVDIGYHVMRAQWGRGYATEAAHAVLRWAFNNLNVHRIQADCTDGNIASEWVLLKCGFKVEGLWRESCWEHERFVDIKQFGILRREYTY